MLAILGGIVLPTKIGSSRESGSRRQHDGRR
jgi:hypothetical protein